jgi:hypothetical protein
VRPLAIAIAAVAMVAGCGPCSDDDSKPPFQSPEGRLIRHWLAALERGDYARAATYFAPGAIVDQGQPVHLRNRVEARLFNSSLPCRADLIALKDERGETVLATFRLRDGPGGACSGRVQVRYTIERGRFTKWFQLRHPEPEPQEPGPTV